VLAGILRGLPTSGPLLPVCLRWTKSTVRACFSVPAAALEPFRVVLAQRED